HPGAAFGPVLNAAPVMWVGRISYSLYLWQQPFLTDTPVWWTQRLGINVLCAFAAAAASYYLVEQPVLAWRARVEARYPSSDAAHRI
ncbi:MAG: hypothetical protein K2X99_09775, partial [Gemmatimonadaceae bacterium]|nr:hypothetical protein [Gemmatimonadaceae bacterium]